MHVYMYVCICACMYVFVRVCIYLRFNEVVYKRYSFKLFTDNCYYGWLDKEFDTKL